MRATMSSTANSYFPPINDNGAPKLKSCLVCDGRTAESWLFGKADGEAEALDA